MKRQAAWRMLLTAAFLALMPWVAQAEIDPAIAQKLLAGDGAADDQFGISVAVSGDTAVIGAIYDDDKGFGSGSAYVFVRAADGTWSQQAKLTAADGAAGDRFGVSVAVSGDTAVIGAYEDDNIGSGLAYIFVQAADGTWSQQAKLTAADGMAGDEFGVSVAVSSGTAVIGAWHDNDKGHWSGSAYVFVRAADSTWHQQAKLTAADGMAGDLFGNQVAVSGDTAVIGAIYDDDKGDMSGSAYVFVQASDGTWSQQEKLTAADIAVADLFGASVAVSGDTAVIGAYGDDDKGNMSGSAYVFVQGADGTWSQQAKLTAADGAAGDLFGKRVAVSGGTAVIVAVRDDDKGSDSGSAYVFARTADGTWSQQAKLTAADGAAYDYFGVSVAVSGDTAVIGARSSAYVFSSGNTAPVANAGQNQTAVQGNTVCFDGSGSTDADNDPLAYLWTLTAPVGSSAVLDNPTAEKPCITADLPGTYQVSLVVNDGTVDSAPSTAEAVAISCQDVAEEAIKAVNALDPLVFDNKNNQKNLTKGILEVIALVDQQLYAEALLKLEGGSVLGKTKGCATAGAPDNDDWIKDCASQAQVYPLLQQTIVCVQRL